MAKFNDLTGQRFGRLVVKKRGEDLVTTRHYTRWYCDCDCGKNNILVTSRNLVSGKTTSCGCYKLEKLIERNKKSKQYNKYDLSGEYGIGWTSNTNEEFYFDLEDYDKIKDYYWSEKSTIRNGRIVYTSISTSIGENIVSMAKVITGENFQDHINHNTFDNRKNNLRNSTYQQNNKNKKMSIRNSSGVTGVSNHYFKNKWVARICVNYQDLIVGVYDNFDDAVKARLEAEKKYYGEFAPQKHLYEEYGIGEQS